MIFTGGSSALKVYPVLDADPVSAIFCVTNNYVYDTAIVAGAVPYGTNGFIVVHKGGDAAIFKEGQAVDAPPQWPDDITFQTTSRRSRSGFSSRALKLKTRLLKTRTAV